MIAKGHVKIARIHDFEKGRHWAIFDQENILHGSKYHSCAETLKKWTAKYGVCLHVGSHDFKILTPDEFAAAVLKERDPVIQITPNMRALLDILPAGVKDGMEKLGWSGLLLLETSKELIKLRLAHTDGKFLVAGPGDKGPEAYLPKPKGENEGKIEVSLRHNDYTHVRYLFVHPDTQAIMIEEPYWPFNRAIYVRDLTEELKGPPLFFKVKSAIFDMEDL